MSACDDLDEPCPVDCAGNVELLLEGGFITLDQDLPVHLLRHELLLVLPQVHALQERQDLQGWGEGSLLEPLIVYKYRGKFSKGFNFRGLEKINVSHFAKP